LCGKEPDTKPVGRGGFLETGECARIYPPPRGFAEQGDNVVKRRVPGSSDLEGALEEHGGEVARTAGPGARTV